MKPLTSLTWFAALALVAGLACFAGAQPAPAPDEETPTAQNRDQGVRFRGGRGGDVRGRFNGGGGGFGGGFGRPDQGGPPAFLRNLRGTPAVVATAQYLFIVRDNTVFQLNVDTLEILRQVELPEPEPKLVGENRDLNNKQRPEGARK